MERYSEYKDSGIYYIKTIPSKWNVLKAKYLFKQEKRSVRKEDEVVTCFRDGQVTLRKNRRIEGFTNSEKEIGYQGIRKGDLVIHNMDAFAGAIGVSDSDGKSTPVYSVCTPITKNINVYYYCYLMRSLSRDGFILSLAKGIRERSTDFRYSDFKELLLPVPSLDEQNTIVNYIQAKTSQLDEAIAQQQHMIDLLNERKQIIIQHAVTKGLDPNAEMVDSGVEWIGKMPGGWKVIPFKLCADINCGRDYKHIVSENGYPVIGSGGQFAYAKEYMYDGEVVFLGRKGTIDRPLYFKGKFWAVDTMFYAIPNKRVNGRFLYYMAGLFPFKYYSTATALPSMTQRDLGSIKICVPQISEQNKIVESILQRIEPIEKSLQQIEHRISLLRERKQIIINEVVTGKVKVS